MDRVSDDISFISRLYRRCLISSMIAILGSVLGQIVNTAIIGQTFGAQELSVIGITLPVYYVYATAGALLGVGGTAVCARLIGKNRFEDSNLAFTCTYLMIFIIAAILTAAMLLFQKQIGLLLGVSPDMVIYRDVMEYMRVLSIGGIGIMSIYPAFNFLRLDGRNTATAAVFFVMAGVNIAFSGFLLLIMKTSVSGAAVSTVCGAGAAGITGAILLFTGSKSLRCSLPIKGMDGIKVIGRTAISILLSGSPSALENLCILTRTMVLNRMLAPMVGGVIALSAFKVTDSINSFAQVFIAGASGSMIPFIGVFAPEKDTGSIRQLLRLGLKWGGAMSLTFTAVCLVFTKPITDFFGMSGAEGLSAIRIFALSLPLAMLNNILVCLYQANAKTAVANILTLGRSFAWVILSATVLSPRIGASSVWHSFWIAELLAFGVVAIHAAYYRLKNKYLSPLFLLDTEAEKNGTYKSFSVKNDIASITGASESITDFCSSNGLNRKQTMAIHLAIEEMLVSIHTHALPSDASLTMNVRLLIWEDIVVMRIRNSGKAFNPIEYYEQQKAKQSGEDEMDDLDMLSDSLGIKMIVGLASSVDYRCTFGVNNITVII